MPKTKADPDLNFRFWEQLQRRAMAQGFAAGTDAKIAPRGDRHDNLRFGAGQGNVLYHYRLPPDGRPHVQVSIYDSSPDRSRNAKWFEQLLRSREAIERGFGAKLEWEYEPEDNLGAYVRHHLDGYGSLPSPPEWARLQDAMIEAMRRLYAAVQPYLDAMPREIRQPGRDL
jgi:hypothetical protein